MNSLIRKQPEQKKHIGNIIEENTNQIKCEIK